MVKLLESLQILYMETLLKEKVKHTNPVGPFTAAFFSCSWVFINCKLSDHPAKINITREYHHGALILSCSIKWLLFKTLVKVKNLIIAIATQYLFLPKLQDYHLTKERTFSHFLKKNLHSYFPEHYHMGYFPLLLHFQYFLPSRYFLVQSQQRNTKTMCEILSKLSIKMFPLLSSNN